LPARRGASSVALGAAAFELGASEFVAKGPRSGGVGGTEPSFRFFSVEPPLDRYVAYLYASVVPKGFMERVVGVRLPELEPQLVFALEEGHALPGARPRGDGLWASFFLQPAHLHVIPIPGTIRAAVGASLRPAGLRLLLRGGAGDLTSAPLISLDALCAGAGAMCERLMDASGPLERVALLRQHLHERALRAERGHASAEHAVELIEAMHGCVSIHALARACGVTSRTLHSRLLAETGMPPKHLARVARIRRALQLVLKGGVPPSDDAGPADGFSDQAHMCREFRALLGTTPGALHGVMHAPPRSPPRLTTDRDLVGTGLLILPSAPRSDEPA